MLIVGCLCAPLKVVPTEADPPSLGGPSCVASQCRERAGPSRELPVNLFNIMKREGTCPWMWMVAL